jgi:hypothetical protein
VAAQHHDHCALLARRARNGINDELEVARDEYIGQGGDEIAEGSPGTGARRGSELTSGDLVGPPLDRDGANSG